MISELTKIFSLTLTSENLSERFEFSMMHLLASIVSALQGFFSLY